MAGSANVLVNGRPALRANDTGIHAACCGANTWRAKAGSSSVFINGKPAFRLNDPTVHCGGMGRLIEGSVDVIVGDVASSGASITRAARPASNAATTSATVAQDETGASQASARQSGGPASTAATRASSPPPAAPRAPVAAPQLGPVHAVTWVEIVLVGEDDKPIPGERYRIVPPDGIVRTGNLNSEGRARILGLEPGSCSVSFPALDPDAWEPI